LEVTVKIHFFLTSSLDGVNGQFHVSAALLPGKDPSISIAESARWTSEPVWPLWRIVPWPCR